jgi:septum formation protein
MPRLVLASTSPMRRQLLAAAGLDALGVAPGVDESAVTADSPVQLVRELARRKAHAVAVAHPDAWVVGSDQVIFDPDHGEPWGKPADGAQHLERLQALRGRVHHLVTGLCLVGPEGEEVEHELTRLRVRADLGDDELAAYVATGEASGCAGGYAVEGRGAFLFEVVDGDWNNVLGLPLFRLFTLLRKRGWRFGGAT